MTGDLIVSAFLGFTGLLLATKSIKDYLNYRKERYVEGLAAAANKKVLARLEEQDECLEKMKEEIGKMKEKFAAHDGLFEAFFRMRKE